jgi:hypothetical protein
VESDTYCLDEHIRTRRWHLDDPTLMMDLVDRLTRCYRRYKHKNEQYFTFRPRIKREQALRFPFSQPQQGCENTVRNILHNNNDNDVERKDDNLSCHGGASRTQRRTRLKVWGYLLWCPEVARMKNLYVGTIAKTSWEA